MEQKKITYTGIDTDDVTRLLEEGNDKQAEKGWREFRVDMLSSSTVRVTYVRGEPDEEDEDADDLFVIGERDTINIETQLRDAIVTLVDPRPLCSSDCAGLCDVCGEKWADLPADHDHFVVDPRLASLASLLGDTPEPGRS